MNSICRCKPLLGTYVEVTIIAEENDDTLIDMSIAAYAEVEKIEALMSFHDPESELSQINNNAYIQSCRVSAETEEVLVQALALSKLTQGLFDISIAPELIKQGLLPNKKIEVDATANWRDVQVRDGTVSFNKRMQLDLGGIAKGYAVDKALSAFSSDVKVTINAGGDLRMNHWKNESVYVKHANPKIEELIKLPMLASAVATSGNYYLEEKSAIIAPSTKEPIHESRSFSVFAPNCMLADALTKVAYQSNEYDELFDSLNAKMLVVDQLGNVIRH